MIMIVNNMKRLVLAKIGTMPLCTIQILSNYPLHVGNWIEYKSIPKIHNEEIQIAKIDDIKNVQHLIIYYLSK